MCFLRIFFFLVIFFNSSPSSKYYANDFFYSVVARATEISTWGCKFTTRSNKMFSKIRN